MPPQYPRRRHPQLIAFEHVRGLWPNQRRPPTTNENQPWMPKPWWSGSPECGWAAAWSEWSQGLDSPAGNPPWSIVLSGTSAPVSSTDGSCGSITNGRGSVCASPPPGADGWLITLAGCCWSTTAAAGRGENASSAATAAPLAHTLP